MFDLFELILAGFIWSTGWIIYFAYTSAPPSRKNFAILSAPWIVMSLGIMAIIARSLPLAFLPG